MHSRDLIAFALLGAALGAFTRGAVAYIRLWPHVRPELLEDAAYQHAHYGDVARGGSTYGIDIYDFLDDIWTPEGRRLRRRAILATVSGVALLWIAMAHWIGRW